MINFGVTERKRQGLERRMDNCNLLENDIEEMKKRFLEPLIIMEPLIITLKNQEV